MHSTATVMDMAAYVIKLLNICFLNSSFVSSSLTQIVGKAKPIAAPRACETTHRVIAITRSFGPNQLAANFAGTFTRNG